MERKEAVGIVAVTVGITIGLTAIGIGVAGLVTRQDTVTEPGTITLVPCSEEDSHDCYWDASTMGNGTGTSFVDIDGVLYFAEMR